MTKLTGLQYSMLDGPIIRYRRAADGQTVHVNLPQLFVALAGDEVRDYPALRPHQRHPWHAFLVQLAAIALHKAERTTAFETAEQWRDALLALTPDDPDGAAWCLVSPTYRPAFMQAPNPKWDQKNWDTEFTAPDELDMLGTSKNHDLKASRAHLANAEDWLFALISLQTQEGSNSGSHKGISRMNSGSGSRSGFGVKPLGGVGNRWNRDTRLLEQVRPRIAEEHELKDTNGLALIWLEPWDGASSIPFSELDPLYIEICRRVRIFERSGRLYARRAKTPISRVDAASRKGVTGDPWMPIDISKGEEKSLSLQGSGFDYKLIYRIVFSGDYVKSAVQRAQSSDGDQLVFLAQGVARGNSKTEGFHERRIPISPKFRGLLLSGRGDVVAQIAAHRIAAIDGVRTILWSALATLFSNGKGNNNKETKAKANRFSSPFESAEDGRFFDDLNMEIEAEDASAQRLQWLLRLVDRAEGVLRAAFDAGPRNGVQKYRAQSTALDRFHSGLRSEKFPISELVNHYRQQKMNRQEETLEHT